MYNWPAMPLTCLPRLTCAAGVSWRYADTAALLCERLGVTPKRAVYGPVGGESPIRYLHEAAQRIARGEQAIEREHDKRHQHEGGGELQHLGQRMRLLSRDELRQEG